MKRLFFSAAFLICSLTTFAQYSGSGNGTEDDPYLIFNENQLSQVSNFLNQEGVVFKLMKDLDLTSWIAENNPRQGWVPIGVETTPFKGIFNGNNHKISGVFISRSTIDNVGFFGYVDGATITDLTIEGTTVSGANNTGAFIGYATGTTLSNLVCNGTSVTGTNEVGGFAGQLFSTTVNNCRLTLTGSTGVEGSNNIGGFVGKSLSSNYTAFTASSTVKGATAIGGFAGSVSTGVFTNGQVNTTITASAENAGGFIGDATTYTLSDIQVLGDVTNTGTAGCVAGFVAKSSGKVSLTNCSYTGDIVGNQDVGGIIGLLLVGSRTTLTSCASKGRIINNGDYSGGVIARSAGACIDSIESCSHFGDILGQSYVGGVIGAVISTNEQPHLATFTTYTSNTYYSEPNITKIYEDVTIKETIVNGMAKTSPFNNCTAIGNINGNNWVGGLIGSDMTSYGYTPDAVSKTFGDYCYIYLFKDGVYTGQMSRPYSNLTFTHSYTRNTISLAITNSYYSGTINGVNHVGGLVGQKNGGSIEKNYTYANVYGSSNVGGIVGKISAEKVESSYNTTTLKSNVAINSTISATSSNLGRIYGTADTDYTVIGALASAEGNRALTQTRVILSGVVQEFDDDLQNGTSAGPSALRLKANYVSWGWNFDENWDILETECYPYKKYQAAPPVIESDLVSQATSISGKSVNGGTVYLYYKDREPVSTVCDGHQWTFNTEALQSGAQVQIYADVEGMTPSYFTTTTVGYPGSGTEDDPWRIYTAEDLQGASNRGYYKLMNDVDLTQWINENSPTTGWPAIGRNSGEATYIDGDGHRVTGLWMNTTENYNGLFSNFSAGQIKNLTVEVATGKKVKGSDYTGILIGRNANGRLVNCTVKGTVEGSGHVGGLVGYAENTTISAITADANITGTSHVGGVVGQAANCEISTCNAATTITSSGDDSKVGGLIGYAQGGSVSKCTAQNALTASGTMNYVGGLIGYSETPVTLSFSTGSVAASGNDSYTGGLVGYATSPIANSYSTANASGTQFTGGLVGYTFNSIDKCYAKGDVYGVMYGGGVIGELDGSAAALTNSVAACNTLTLTAQSAWGSRVIGGYKNGATDPDDSNYALSTMQVSINNVPQTKTDDLVEGIAKTPAELMQADTYISQGWDFTEIWGIDEGQMYPYLLWEVDVNPVADISFDKTTLLLAVGKSETISANVLPLGATNKRLAWASSNTAVATVDDGVVTAIAVGTATITATSTDGSNISATCAVTVTANHDEAIAALQAIVDRAQSLYDNSTEGENIGQYAAGARAQLLAVINSVNARISSTMSDEAITQCTNEINAAIELFESKKVTAGDDTDISQLANTIYLERAEAAPGSQLTLSVKMKNAVAAESFGFDLYLPDGVTVATDEDGFPMASLSTQRTTTNKTNIFNADFKQDGALNILAYSTRGYTISGNDGEVALITINIEGSVESGEYPIIIRNIAIADENSVSYRVEYVKSTLAISSYILGDANSDTYVDVGDLTAISHYILERPDATFNAKAADANEDNNIDVGDLTAVSHIILWGSVQRPNAPRQARTFDEAPKQTENDDVTDIADLDNVIYVEPFTATANSTYTMSVKMKNAVVAEGFGFDLVLPDGITVATDEDGFPLATLSTERTTERKTTFNADFKVDGTLNIQAYSPNGSPISGNDGEVAQIVLNIAADVAPDTYPIYIRNIAISDVNATSHRTDEIETAVTVTEASDYDVVLDETSTTAPDDSDGEVNMLVKRTIKANEWSTICLPFNLTEEQFYQIFGDDVQLAEFIDYEVNEDATAITVNFADADLSDGFLGNYPYIIKTSQDITDFTVKAEVQPDEENAVAEYAEGRGAKRHVYGTFIGTYHAGTLIPENNLFISGNEFWYSKGNTQMKGFRAYFDFEDVLADMTNARVSIAIGDNTPTSIKTPTSYAANRSMYDLQGRMVKSDAEGNDFSKTLPKGIYIMNNKKVIIK